MAVIPLSKIVANPEQPRKEFDPDELQSLAASIKKHDLINPISVEQAGDLYILIDGDRRVRAARMAGLTEIEASVRPSMDGGGQRERLLLAMTANLQRTDFNPIEEAQAYKRMRELGMTNVVISQMVGKVPSAIGYYLRLMDLDTDVQSLFAQNRLPIHGQVISALLALPEEMRVPLASGFARRRTGINGILNTCKRMMNRRSGSQEKVDGDFGPGMQLAWRQTKSHKMVGQWNALAHVKKAPPWAVIQVTALETCKGCAIADLASESNCRDCPLVDFLKILMSGGNQ
jgi:ParB/RepB/Spo0J family partition protein